MAPSAKSSLALAAGAAAALAAVTPAAADCLTASTAYGALALDCATDLATAAINPEVACASECYTSLGNAYTSFVDECSDDPAVAAAMPASNPFEALCDGTAGGGGVVPAMPPLPGFDMGDLAGGLECMLNVFEDSLKLTTDPDCVAMTTAFEAVGASEAPTAAQLDDICESSCKGTVIKVGKETAKCMEKMSEEEKATIETSDIGEQLDTMCSKSGGEYCIITVGETLAPVCGESDVPSDDCIAAISDTSTTCLNTYWAFSSFDGAQLSADLVVALENAGASEPSPAAATVASPVAAMALAGAAALAVAALA